MKTESASASSNAGTTALTADAADKTAGAGVQSSATQGGEAGGQDAAAKAAAEKAAADKVAGDKAAAEKTAADAAKAEIEIRLPEGFDAKDAGLAKFKALAKELGIKSEQAQKLFDFDVSRQKAQLAAFQASEEKADAERRDALKADKEIGGDKLDASLKLARKALAQAFPDRAILNRFASKLDGSRLGDDADMVRLLVWAGRKISEDSVTGTAGNGAGSQQKDLHREMYPTMFPKES